MAAAAVDHQRTDIMPILKANHLLTSRHTAHQEIQKTHMPNVSNSQIMSL